ncbi:MAG TPA: methyl-accepting chemotaxis protein [Symbiobacteriaceae bacterium]
MHDLLRTIIQLLPLIQRITHEEAAVGVSDLERYLAYSPGKRLNFKLKVGDLVPETSGGRAAMKSGSMLVKEQPSSLFGVPFLSMSMPIRDAGGQIIGSVVTGMPLHLEEALTGMAGELAAAMTQFSGTFKDIAGVSENTAQTATVLAGAAAQMNTALNETQSVTGSIAKVTDQTRLLGLNALIESAHAGSAGAGFGVVAREIQVLAQRSMKATQDMNRSLGELATQNSTCMSEIQSLQADSETLHAQVEECLAIVENLTTMAQKLKLLADRSDVPA